MARFAGIDVGTTSVKAAVFDATGRQLAYYAGTHTTQRVGKHVEQDPDDWMRHVLAALGQFEEAFGPGGIAAAGLCSQVNTHVFVDADGAALMPAIIWQDGRCAAEAAELDANVEQADKLLWWGAPLPIDASHVLARMAWVQRHRPDEWAKTRWVMAPKDYCLFKLTGEVAADPLSSFGVIDQRLHYIPALTRLVEGAAGRLPPLRGIMETVGTIRSGLPCSGLRMVAGTMDAWAGFVGAGAVNAGDCVALSGTSEVGGIVSPMRVPTPGVIAFPDCAGLVMHAGPTQSGGASVAWLSRLLGKTAAEISALAAAVPQHDAVPLFLPHLQGERAPIWDIAARGSFAGLDASMGAPHVALAVLEGVAYSLRWLMQSLARSAEVTPALLLHSGGGAQSDIWCQIKADVLGLPLQRAANRNSGVLGAAILAGTGSGTYGSLGEAARQLVRYDRSFEPEVAQAPRHAFGFDTYRALYETQKPINAAFGRFYATC